MITTPALVQVTHANFSIDQLGSFALIVQLYCSPVSPFSSYRIYRRPPGSHSLLLLRLLSVHRRL